MFVSVPNEEEMFVCKLESESVISLTVDPSIFL